MKKTIGEYEITSGTVIVGEERLPAYYVHWLPDEFHDGDLVYYGDDDLLGMEEEDITDTLRCEWRMTTSWYVDIDTFEEAEEQRMKRVITADTRILVNWETWRDEKRDMITEYNALPAKELSGVTRDTVIKDLIGAYEQTEPEALLTDDAAVAALYEMDGPWYVETVAELADSVWCDLEADTECAAFARAYNTIDLAFAGWRLNEDVTTCCRYDMPWSENWVMATAINDKTGEAAVICWMMSNPHAPGYLYNKVEDWEYCYSIELSSGPIYWLVDDAGTERSETVIDADDDEAAAHFAWCEWLDRLTRYDRGQREGFYVMRGNSDPENGGLDYSTAALVFDCRRFEPDVHEFGMTEKAWADFIADRVNYWAKNRRNDFDEDDIREDVREIFGDPVEHIRFHIHLCKAAPWEEQEHTLDEAVSEIVNAEGVKQRLTVC